jgi:hypothetical protein
MADPNPRADDLAVAVHAAEHEVRKAHAAPAGAGRIDRINAAELAHSKALQRHSHHLSGQASPMIKVER